MKLIGFVLLYYLNCGQCQFIFPDEFESTDSSRIYGKYPQRRLPFPTLQTPLAASINQNISPLIYNGRNYLSTAGGSGSFVQSSFAEPNNIFNEQNYWTNHVNNILARGVTKFALRMNNAINEYQRTTGSTAGSDRNNIIFSPINLVGTLAIVLTGAAGRTFDEIVNVLGFELGIDVSRNAEILHQMFGILLNSVELGSKMNTRRLMTNGPELSIAGGVFIQDGYSIRPEFRAIAENIYKSDVITVNFQYQAKIAQGIINNWVDTKTHGKIHSLLEESPDVNTKIILASALYFRGEWNQHFVKGATKRKPFFLESGRTIDIDMMYNGGTFPFYEDKQLGVKILGLPYKNTDGISPMNLNADGTFHFEATMYVLLPTSSNANALDTLQSRLSPEIIDQLISRMKNEVCIIGIPRMKLSSSLNLNYALQSLGLNSLFNPAMANLGLLSSGLNATEVSSTNDNPVIFPRFNDDDDEPTTIQPNKVHTGKKNYIRYEDSNGGYIVEQWENGVYLEKIHRVKRERRRTRINSQSFDHQNNYHYGEHQRNKRQTQSIDAGFVRFIKSQRYQSYGLDALRNNANLVNPGLYASDVLHKVEIDITETGTVAAAASGVIIQRNGNQKRIIANRPFLFFIRHDPTKLILFWSTINKPTPNYS
ncbi:hypothetical protein PV328_003920 [Microctonus aethiopoides]|uniref:Serpin domain-containing protein n=1 Tax=Microctonus aethiopoides TaxID=144406 RepID=A0AA39F9F8_9HYME|nr:hypothetical protein PV328_003920 [Microctonus aethiopoides]